MDTLRTQWNEGRDTLGVWLANPSTITAEMAARVGFDYVCIDNQHGVNDYQQTVAMAQAILLGGGTPIARVPWNEPGIIGKMLDGGIEGIIVPMVNSAAEAEAVVRAGRYVPVGARSFGPVVAGMRRTVAGTFLERVQREVDSVIDRRQVIQPGRTIGLADGDKISVTILLIHGHDLRR